MNAPTRSPFGFYLVTVVSGVMFGVGLGLSQMVDRERVLGFLDVAGAWDPTLVFVLGGAVGVTLSLFPLVLRARPWFADTFSLQTRRDIDRPLVLGAAIFGIGWGIAGYCPGPAVAALAQGSWNPVLFLVAFAVGSLVQQQVGTTGRGASASGQAARERGDRPRRSSARG